MQQNWKFESFMVVKKSNNIINFFEDALNVFTILLAPTIYYSSTHPVIRDPASAQKITIRKEKFNEKNHSQIYTENIWKDLEKRLKVICEITYWLFLRIILNIFVARTSGIFNKVRKSLPDLILIFILEGTLS